MRSMQVKRSHSSVAETSVDFVGLLVFALKDSIIDLSMLVIVFVCS
jgi:hypothetical protein